MSFKVPVTLHSRSSAWFLKLSLRTLRAHLGNKCNRLRNSGAQVHHLGSYWSINRIILSTIINDNTISFKGNCNGENVITAPESELPLVLLGGTGGMGMHLNQV